MTVLASQFVFTFGCGELTKFQASVPEDALQRKLEALQQRCRQHITAFAREFDWAIEMLAVSPVNAYQVEIRIHDPVFRHAKSFVEPPLDRFVPFARGRRPDLHDEIRSAADVLRGQYIRCARP